MNLHFKRLMALSLILSLVLVKSGRLEAMMVPAEQAGQAAVQDRAQDLQNIQTFLQQKQVRQRLADMGLTEEQVQIRLNNLSDQELNKVAQNLEQQNPAGDAAGILVVVVLVLLIIYLIQRI